MINPCFSHTDSTVHVKPQNNDRIQFIFTIKNKLIHKVQKSRQIIWFSFTVSVFLQNILGSGVRVCQGQGQSGFTLTFNVKTVTSFL